MITLRQVQTFIDIGNAVVEDFDDSFLKSLEKWLEGGKPLTEKQEAAFKKVARFIMEHSIYHNDNDIYDAPF